MKKKLFFDILYVVLILAVIGFMIWLVYYLKGEGKACLSSPIAYFEGKTHNTCYCMKTYDAGYEEIPVQSAIP